jgi:MFS family permease
MAHAAPVSLRSYVALLRTNRNFRLLWNAQLISEIGDWLYSVSLYSLLLEQTGSARSVALAFVLQVLPQFFAAPTAGVLNDRLSRKRVMIATDWARAAIVLLMLIGQLPGFVWLLYLLLFLETIGWAMFEPARSSVIPNITSTDDEKLVANSLSSMTWSFTLAIGSALGGVLAASFGRSTVFLLNSSSFVLSAVLISRMRFKEPHVEHLPPLCARDLIDFSHIAEGIRYVRRDARMLATMFVKTGLALMGTNWVLLPILGERVFPMRIGGMSDRSAGMLGMSILMGCRGIGALVGPFVAARLTGSSAPRLRAGILAGFLIGALGYFMLGMSPNLLAACAAVVFAHSGGSITWVYSTTMLQSMTDDRFRGRVFSAEYGFNTLLLSVVTWSVGSFADTGVRVRTLAMATGFVLLIPAVLWASAQRLWAKPRS